MPTPTTTLRLRPPLRAAIERIARHTRRSFSEVAQTLLDEGLRMNECPGIHFADEPAGRVAKVTGTGLGVWEVVNIHRGLEGSARKLRRLYPHLSTAQLEAARLYYARYPEEIDALIADNVALYEAGHARSGAAARRR